MQPNKWGANVCVPGKLFIIDVFNLPGFRYVPVMLTRQRCQGCGATLHPGKTLPVFCQAGQKGKPARLERRGYIRNPLGIRNSCYSFENCYFASGQS